MHINAPGSSYKTAARVSISRAVLHLGFVMKKKKETGNSRRRRHKSSLSSFWMMASWVVGVCLLRARRSITPRPLRTRPQGGTLKSSHRESSSHHESSQSSSLMPANQNGGASASPVVMPRVALPGSWQKVPAKSQAMVWKGMGGAIYRNKFAELTTSYESVYEIYIKCVSSR